MELISIFFILFLIGMLSYPAFKSTSVIFYFIKNNIKPIKLPKYQWREIRLNDSLGYEWGSAKFYSTKKWVELYISMLGNLDDVDKNERRIIIPKWKIIFYNGESMKLLGVTSTDYERYNKWQK
jgi:hypothetical protein